MDFIFREECRKRATYVFAKFAINLVRRTHSWRMLLQCEITENNSWSRPHEVAQVARKNSGKQLSRKCFPFAILPLFGGPIQNSRVFDNYMTGTAESSDIPKHAYVMGELKVFL